MSRDDLQKQQSIKETRSAHVCIRLETLEGRRKVCRNLQGTAHSSLQQCCAMKEHQIICESYITEQEGHKKRREKRSDRHFTVCIM